MYWSLLVDLLIFFLVVFSFWYWKVWRHSSKFPPGPRFPVPILGDTYILGNDLEKGFKNLTLKHGKICGLWLGPQRAVVVSDFEILQEMLNRNETSDRQIWAVADILKKGLSFGSTPGVLFSNGFTWSEMRRNSLHTLKNLGFGKNILEDIVDDSVDNLIEHIDRNYLDKPIDVISFFHISVLSSLWRIISGEHLKMGDPKLEKLVFMVQTMVKEFGNPRTVISFNYPLLYQIINALQVIKITKSMHGVIDFTSALMNDLKKRIIDGDNPLNFTESFLHKIQETSDPNDPFYSKTGELNLTNTLTDLFIAGSDTTAVTLDWAMLFMILNPEVQTKVRQELDHNFGTNKAKFDERHKVPYTEAVIHEIQRRANILPLSVFHSTRTSVDIEEYSVPAGTVYIPFIGDIMNDPEHFPEPSKFQPERYLKSENGSDNLKFHAHPRVIPFGLGKRKCLGEKLAKMSLYKFFSVLIQKYEIVSGQTEPITDERDLGFIKAPLKYKLIFKPRAECK